MLDIGVVAGIAKESQIGQPVGGQVKRTFDVVITSLILVVLAQVFFVLSNSTETDRSRSDNLSPHTGRVQWAAFKFRTMVADSENRLKLLLETDPVARADRERDRKLKNDPRITPLGSILRTSSADELPQLLNVLRGEMSLVGPRPVVAEELARYGEHVGLYLSSRPGITGSWQISGRSDCSFQQRVTQDADYVRNWRFSTDLSILVRTVSAVIQQRGSY